MKKILMILAVGLMACMACQNGAQEQEEVDAYDSTAMHLAVLPSMECLPFYVAEQCGIFDSLGLKMQLVTYQAAMDADTAFVNGDVDGTVSDIIKANILRAGGDSVRIVMAHDLDIILMTGRKARIRKTESLKEKIIALTRNSALDFTADKILEGVKLTTQDLNKPQINDLRLRCNMLQQEQYDGALMTEPYASMCEAKGAVRVTSTRKMRLPLAAVIFREKTIKEHRTEIQLLVKAYNMAVDMINANKVSNHYVDLLPTDPQCADTLCTIQDFPHATLPADTMLIAARKWAQGRTLLKNNVETADLVDRSFVK